VGPFELFSRELGHIGKFHQITDIPGAGHKAGRHGWGRFQGLVNPDKVVIDERNGDAVGQHLGLFLLAFSPPLGSGFFGDRLAFCW
jgi:hypothetical protein